LYRAGLLGGLLPGCPRRVPAQHRPVFPACQAPTRAPAKSGRAGTVGGAGQNPDSNRATHNHARRVRPAHCGSTAASHQAARPEDPTRSDNCFLGSAKLGHTAPARADRVGRIPRPPLGIGRPNSAPSRSPLTYLEGRYFPTPSPCTSAGTVPSQCKRARRVAPASSQITQQPPSSWRPLTPTRHGRTIQPATRR
jgi:hypothetical protein